MRQKKLIHNEGVDSDCLKSKDIIAVSTNQSEDTHVT